MANLSFPRRREPIEMADDGGRERTIDHLRERVVAVVVVARVDLVRQPFRFQSATGIVARHGLQANIHGVADGVA